MPYLLRRLGFFLLTLWAALTLNFIIPRFMPGSPLQALRDRTHNKLSPAALEQMLTSYGFKPDENVVVQYLDYLKNMVTGQWGISIGATLGEPVTRIVRQALPGAESGQVARAAADALSKCTESIPARYRDAVTDHVPTLCPGYGVVNDASSEEDRFVSGASGGTSRYWSAKRAMSRNTGAATTPP